MSRGGCAPYCGAYCGGNAPVEEGGGRGAPRPLRARAKKSRKPSRETGRWTAPPGCSDRLAEHIALTHTVEDLGGKDLHLWLGESDRRERHPAPIPQDDGHALAARDRAELAFLLQAGEVLVESLDRREANVERLSRPEFRQPLLVPLLAEGLRKILRTEVVEGIV
mmetsp:Transcript_87052/g.242343  ORF Transcript_87052/g.242343 Transcript_87052/m.242343 type:complete len:166 (-) Transcript_87052:317-814(-)